MKVARLPDGTPWGLGARQVDTAPADWPCPGCNRTAPRRHSGRHTYADGVVLCSTCARQWWALLTGEEFPCPCPNCRRRPPAPLVNLPRTAQPSLPLWSRAPTALPRPVSTTPAI